MLSKNNLQKLFFDKIISKIVWLNNFILLSLIFLYKTAFSSVLKAVEEKNSILNIPTISTSRTFFKVIIPTWIKIAVFSSWSLISIVLPLLVISIELSSLNWK